MRRWWRRKSSVGPSGGRGERARAARRRKRCGRMRLSLIGRAARHTALLGAGARDLAGVASARLVKVADHGAEDPPLSLNSSEWLGAVAAEGQQ